MKKVALVLNVFFVLFLLSSTCFAQSSKYETAILKGKALLGEGHATGDFQKAINYFERIAKKETDEWLPVYYQAFAMSFAANNLEGVKQKDQEFNKALKVLESAEKIEENSEVLALKGFINMLKLGNDPQNLGPLLPPVINQLYGKALKLDSQNPRAMLFLGQMQYGSAEYFGGGTEDACATIQKAYAIFEKQQGQEKTIMPAWGMESAKKYIDMCGK
ncbi:hypothetical protein R9C00_23085 [Flammeovirgaceae bacterium SG7u.111]|nr:hypothetical protein [Flammeovirgaceae bacterium SG7u.132]WPO34590.1 hypothetical protein R9C00_23085 [Flammeovirgaceae bacterium SG7u.111]